MNIRMVRESRWRSAGRDGLTFLVVEAGHQPFADSRAGSHPTQGLVPHVISV